MQIQGKSVLVRVSASFEFEGSGYRESTVLRGKLKYWLCKGRFHLTAQPFCLKL